MSTDYETVCVLGLGYIGLPTASIMAMRGFRVHGVDVNQQAVDTINQGRIHIHEPDLDALVKAAVGSGRLSAHLRPQPADVFIVAVPTPFKDTHQPDLTYVEAATRSLAGVLTPGNLVILESTCPVSTTESMARWIAEERPDLSLPAWTPLGAKAAAPVKGAVLLAHCPERVLPGQILRELVENDRIIGGIDPASAERCAAIYRKFVIGKLLLSDCRTAELAKLTENAFRDVNIAFANELSLICDRLGIDVWELIRLANHHPRVKILNPGPGVGGHCIAVDPWFIVSSAPEEARLIRTAREVNDHKPVVVISKVEKLAERFKYPVIACLGLAFKADVDDLRESPAVEITRHLAQRQIGRVLAVEPYISQLPKALSDSGAQLVDLDAALAKADVVLLLVDHRVFRALDRKRLEGKAVVDTRGCWR